MFGLGRADPSRFPYRDRPQAVGAAPGAGNVIRARLVLVFGPSGSIDGVFVYAPGTTPALGNPPVDSITQSATDPFGNPVKPGITTYGTDGTAVQLRPGTTATTRFYSGDAAEIEPGLIGTAIIGGGGLRFIEAFMQAPRMSGEAGGANASIQVTSPTADLSVSPQVGMSATDGTISTFLTLYPGNARMSGGSGVTIWVFPSGDTTGATDFAAINPLLSAGTAVQLLPGTYWINAPFAMNVSGGCLRGCATDGIDPGAGTTIELTSTFSGSAAIMVGTGAASVRGCQVRGIAVDGTAAPGTVGGLLATGNVTGLVLEDLLLAHVTGVGIDAVGGVSGNPNTWRGHRVFVRNAGSYGFHVSPMTDSTWTDCESISSGSHGWYFPTEGSNVTILGCRSEFSAGDGWHFTGAWFSGTGSGACRLVGCSTDRNALNGVSIDATGNTPLLISAMSLRRDYSSSAVAGAGIYMPTPGIPVIIDGLTVYPGVDDSGGGNLSPFYGVQATAGTYAALVNAYVHAANTPLAGVSPFGITRGRAVTTRAGSTSAPGAVTSVADWG